MVPKSPKAFFRLALWIVLLSLGGCGGSQPDPKASAEAICAAAQTPLPASATVEAREIAKAARAFCVARQALEKDGGG